MTEEVVVDLRYLQVYELDRAIRYGYNLEYHFGENPLTTVCKEFARPNGPHWLISSACFLIRSGFKPDEKTWLVVANNFLRHMCYEFTQHSLFPSNSLLSEGKFYGMGLIITSGLCNRTVIYFIWFGKTLGQPFRHIFLNIAKQVWETSKNNDHVWLRCLPENQ